MITVTNEAPLKMSDVKKLPGPYLATNPSIEGKYIVFPSNQIMISEGGSLHTGVNVNSGWDNWVLRGCKIVDIKVEILP